MTPFTMIFFGALFWLLFGHAIADFALQSDAMVKSKNFCNPIDTDKVHPGQKPQVCWYYWMASHCMIHAGMVTMITGSIFLGVAEFVLHFIGDCLRCAGVGNIHTDQFFHVACKILWAFFAADGGLVDVNNNGRAG